MDTNEHLTNQVRTLIQMGKLRTVEAVLYEATQNGDSAEIARLWELLGIVAHSRQELLTAQAALETASAVIPLSLHGQVALASCYLASNHIESARAILLHIAGRTDCPTELLAVIASGLGRIGENELALGACRDAAVRSPESPEPFMGMAYYLRRLRRPTEQIVSVLFRAHCLAPDDRDCRIQLAWLLHECRRSDEGACLIEALPLEEFTCIRCLTLMQTIFRAAANEDGVLLCRLRLDGIASERAWGS